MHMHTAGCGVGEPNSPPPIHMLVGEVAREHFNVGWLSMGHTLSLQSPPGSVEEWWGSNTPVTLVSLLVTIHGVDRSYQLRVFSVEVVV